MLRRFTILLLMGALALLALVPASAVAGTGQRSHGLAQLNSIEFNWTCDVTISFNGHTSAYSFRAWENLTRHYETDTLTVDIECRVID